MKRERLLLHSSSCEGNVLRSPDMASEKAKRWTEAIQNDSGLDELLAVLGYKVKESEMADVAEKLEQLEAVIGCSSEGVSQIASETVHYNPSDLSAWIETMLSELNPVVDPHLSTGNHVTDCDLKAIPGKAIFATDTDTVTYHKRLKPNFTPSWTGIDPLRPVMILDSQENGIRLVHTLTACAEAVQQDDPQLAEALVKKIAPLAAAQEGPMGKVATFFAEALSRRIYRLFPESPLDPSVLDVLQMHFYDACPYFKFAHFTANQAILEAIDGRSCVHVIDFSMNQGMQWPALMQALAIRSGGPPSFRLTGITRGSENREVGNRLAQFAETIKIEFSYRGFVLDCLSDLETNFLDIRPGEAVVINSVFELHRLLARPGSVEKLLRLVEGIKPVVFTVVEHESNHNGPVFLDRFMESLHYYSTVFDSLEGCGWSSPVSGHDRAMAEVYLGQQICNVVACEGVDRVERFEPLVTWRTRFGSAGFEPFRLGSNAFKQASMLLDLFEGGDGYRVEENGGCLLLGWHTRPLVATSAWRPVSG